MLAKVILWVTENPQAAETMPTIGAALIGIIGVVLGAILNHLLGRIQLRVAQKLKFEESIGEKIAQSLILVLDVEREANVFEVYDIENRINDLEDRIEAFGEDTYYHSIMDNWQTITEYRIKLEEARGQYEMYLSQDVASYLWYGAEYFKQLIDFIRREQMTENVREMGTMFIWDIMVWREKLEACIVKDINAHTTKLVEHKGTSWENKKAEILETIYKKSLLNTVLTNPEAEATQIVMSFVQELRTETASETNIVSSVRDRIYNKINHFFRITHKR